jgi:26S proteasome regulatory subunit N12
MPTNQSSDLASLVDSLQRSFDAQQFSSLPPVLTRAKLLLAASNALTPTAHTPHNDLLLARIVFEIGAYTSIQLQDQSAFVNYLGYLHNFFALGAGGEREAELTGLNLLRLLAENKIAEFHTTLEILGDSSVKGSEPVRFARGLEEWVMEGAYNRVWKAGEGNQVNDYQKFFLHVLMDTIRYNARSSLWA